jgi:DNA polymerase-3 subunit delta
LDFNGFAKKIKQDDIGGVYLLHGPEEYIKDLAIRTVVEKYVAEGLKDINYAKIDASENDIEDIRKASQPLPFMSPKRVVEVHYMPLFLMSAAQIKRAENKKALDALSELIKKCPDDTVLLFVVRGQAAAAVTKIFESREVEFKAPPASQKTAYVARMAREHGLNLPQNMIARFIDYTGMELLELSGEAQKLKAYVGDSEVTQSDIEAVCVAAAEYNVFKMLKLITARNGAGAISEYRSLILSGQSPQAVISMIERQFRALFYNDEIKGAGDLKSAASKLSTRDFVIRNMQRFAAGLSKEQIDAISLWCADADYQVKRGRIGADTSAEMLIMKLINI